MIFRNDELLIGIVAFDMTGANPAGNRSEPKEKHVPGDVKGLNILILL